MKNLVTIEFAEGSFEQGFVIILEIITASEKIKVKGYLPKTPHIPTLLQEWQQAFRLQVNPFRQYQKILPAGHGRIIKGSNSRIVAEKLVKALNQWLDSGVADRRRIRDYIQQPLLSEDEILVIVQTDNIQLRQLPWSEWSLFKEDYKKTETAISPSNYRSAKSKVKLTNTVRVLAVFGDNENIDINFDEKVIRQLHKRNIEVNLLKQPSRQDFFKEIWDKQGWKIFFFAGHSYSRNGETGYFSLNSREYIKIEEIENSVSRAVENGLKLAIFNSCDGLGIANQLAALNLPQSIVMREEIPDTVAQDFLKHFLESFSNNLSFYRSVREAREKLEVWEKLYPGVTWLPIVCQNPSTEPLSLVERQSTIHQISAKVAQNDEITWEIFRNACTKISEVKIDGLLRKHNKNTYLERELVATKFYEFLESEKPGFVLVGKSGVGKSSFIIHLLHLYSTNFKTSLLVYSGHLLNHDLPLPYVIWSDLIKHCNFAVEKTKNISDLDDLFVFIDQGLISDGRKLLLIFDAINESAHVNQYFKQINSFVEKGRELKWLKILITCRPETWRRIKYGISNFANDYYRELDEDDSNIDLEPFNYSHLIEAFDKSELMEVYEKYRSVYEIKTHFSELSNEVKELVRDPLLLNLISRIYRYKHIPSQIRSREIFDQYINRLVRLGTLRLADLRFLKKEILPRMIRGWEFSNFISAEVIESEKTADDQWLFELIHGQKLTSLDFENNYFQNLADAEILEYCGEATNYQIKFKHERFYEYFLSQYVFELAQNSQKIVVYYSNLSLKIAEYSWLWGTFKETLILEFLNNNYEVFTELASSKDFMSRDILVSALQDCVTIDSQKVETITENLIKFSKNKGLEAVNAKRTGIELAYKLKLGRFLVESSSDPLSSVRSVAIQRIWYLCKSDKKKPNEAYPINYGFCILDLLASKTFKHKNILSKVPVVNFLTLNFPIISSLFGISFLLWFDNSNDEVLLAYLKDTWKPTLLKLFLIKLEHHGIHYLINNLIKASLPALLSSIVIPLLNSGEESNHWLNKSELSDFFKLSFGERALFGTLIPYLNTHYGDLRDVRQDIFRLARCRSILAWYLLDALFVRHANVNFVQTFELLKDLIDEISQVFPAPPSIVIPRDVFRFSFNSTASEKSKYCLTFLRSFSLMMLEKHRNTFATRRKKYTYSLVEVYCYVYYQMYGTLDAEYCDELKNILLKERSYDLYKSLLIDDFPSAVGYQSLPTSLVLDILNVTTAEANVEVQSVVAESLARIRALETECVDNFLFEKGISYQFQSIVRDKNVNNLGNVLSYQITQFAMKLLLSGSDNENDDFVMHVFSSCQKSYSLKQWISRSLSWFLRTLLRAYEP